jgi:type IV secretion system protein VirB10
MNSLNNTEGSEGLSVIDSTAGERGLPSLKPTRKKSNVNKLWIVLVVIAALAVAAAGAAIFVKRLSERHLQERDDARTLAAQQTKDDGSGHDFGIDKERLDKERAAKEQRDAQLAASRPSGASGVPAPSGAIAVAPVGGQGSGSYAVANAGAKPVHIETLGERRLDGDLVLKLGKDDITPSDAHAAAATLSGSSGSAQSGFDGRLKPSTLASVTASRFADLSYLLIRGTTIPCVTKTKIVTTYAGMTSCIVTKDVYSADGHTLLVEKNSEVTGEQGSALLQGQARLFVLWSRIVTPTGVKIDVDSPGADSLGASGQDAYVDNHLAARFGGALLLSIISTAGQALGSREIGGGNSQVNLSTTSSSTDDLATETLKNTINIPPTGIENQGSAINIFVARDVDMRSVYELVSQ